MKIECNQTPQLTNPPLPRVGGMVFRGLYEGQEGIYITVQYQGLSVCYYANLATGYELSSHQASKLSVIKLLPNAKVVCGD